MLNAIFRTASALQEESLRRHPSPRSQVDPGRHVIRELIGQNLINLGERIARIEPSKKLGEAA